MITGFLNRFDCSSKQILGHLSIIENSTVIYQAYTLENKELCVQPGCYFVVFYNAPSHGLSFQILVPGRTYILFHAANFYTQLKGCIAPGRKIIDINADGVKDVTYSKNKTKELLAKVKNSWVLNIS